MYRSFKAYSERERTKNKTSATLENVADVEEDSFYTAMCFGLKG